MRTYLLVRSLSNQVATVSCVASLSSRRMRTAPRIVEHVTTHDRTGHVRRRRDELDILPIPPPMEAEEEEP